MKTVVALFDDFGEAQRAVEDLVKANIERSKISLVAGDPEHTYSGRLTQTDKAGDTSAEGAATGAVLGGIGGALLGIGALAIPGIGPVVAAGPLIAGLVGAGVGAASRGGARTAPCHVPVRLRTRTTARRARGSRARS